jgi:hypothetical protein
MIETLFDPPHNATDAEIKAMYPHWQVKDLHAYEDALSGDDRLIGIWNLYRHRGDEAKMLETEARFEDQSIVTMELRYRDIYPTEHFTGR